MKITSLAQYVSKIEESVINMNADYLTTAHPWYRGQKHCDWELLPSLYRLNIRGSFEREMSRDFILKAGSFLKYQPKHYIEWLFIMQHYGIPTRLLDWTESYLIALYFAVEDYNYDADSCVWIMHPWTLNKLILETNTAPTYKYKEMRNYELDMSEEGEGRYVEALHPIAFRPVQNNTRINAQKGIFTIHGQIPVSLNNLKDEIGEKASNLSLEKLTIEKESKKKIYRELFKSGITPSVVFPELGGLAEELKIRYSEEYNNW